jgi:hypothetical protein
VSALKSGGAMAPPVPPPMAKHHAAHHHHMLLCHTQKGEDEATKATPKLPASAE